SGPAKRAECTPGRPPSASTARPESSAIAGSPVARAACRALINAFSANVSAGSSAGATPSSACVTSSRRGPSSSARISASLPGLPVATTQRRGPRPGQLIGVSLRLPGGAAGRVAGSCLEDGRLRFEQLSDALLGEAEQLVQLVALEGM